MKTTEKNMSSESLSELVARAKTGDQAAFTELYNRTSTDLYRSIRAMTRDEDLTWDIQQDAYLHAYQKLDTLDNSEAFFPWLRRIAVNATVSRMRQRLPMTFTELSGDDEDDSFPELPDLNAANQPELSLDRKETSRLVKEILSKLPEEQQLIVGMRYYDELSVKEIASTLNISEGAVKAQLFHGRKKVETAVRALEKQGVKLYGLSPLPFLLALMRQQALPVQASEAALAKTLAKAGIAAGTKAAAPVVLHATRPFFTTVVGKIVLGVVAAGVVVGGVAGYRWVKDNLFEKSAPILMVDTSEDLWNDPTTPTLPVEVDVTGEVELQTTEPIVTEPEITEPAQAPTSGKCGEQMTWNYNTEFGFLTIEGSGDMTDFDKPEDAPWYSFRDEITSVFLSGEITGIGSNAFVGCENPTFNLPETLTRIGENAFEGCKNISLLTLSAELREIGSGAFQNCDGLRAVVCEDGREALDMDLFTACSGLREIWILNQNCELSGKLGAGNQVTICGLPGSTAELYAQENGYAFNPMTDDRDEIAELMTQDADPDLDYAFEVDGVTYRTNSSLHFNGIVAVDGRYVSQILRSVRVSVTEEEIGQARENGVIVINGEEYVYTESADQVKALFDYSVDWEEFEADAWIYKADAEGQSIWQSLYKVLPEDGVYRFQAVRTYENDGYIKVYEPCGWLWMDADSPFSLNGEIVPLAESGLAYGYVRAGNYAYTLQLLLRDDGELILFSRSAGKK